MLKVVKAYFNQKLLQWWRAGREGEDLIVELGSILNTTGKQIYSPGARMAVWWVEVTKGKLIDRILAEGRPE